MQPLAVVTMVYNEKDKLPVWISHYGKQVGWKNCFVIDHGSDDGSTDAISVGSRILLPRTPQDNEKRLQFVKGFCDALLKYYRYIVYVDCDELLVAHPLLFSNLVDYADRAVAPVVNSVGLEVWHIKGEEPDLDSALSIGKQRSWVSFSSSMCKTNFIGKPVTWSVGWHSYDGSPNFDNLFLFHLRHADYKQTLNRLKVTREMEWESASAGAHQRVPDSNLISMMDMYGTFPRIEVIDLLDPSSPIVIDLETFVSNWSFVSEGHPAQVQLGFYGTALVKIPQFFKDAI